ncbi:hypothetical protein C8R45DRAFT_967554 [Mycena sanguinolenta]|nr:hypothetical protein C8R45DRAFT_967554 [Mycena sanguinolenta]
MAPGPFLWLLIGAGLGSWWTSHKRFGDCHFQQRSLGAPPAPLNTSEKSPMPNNSEHVQGYPTHYSRDWEQERARVRQFSRTAEDTVIDLSESTLTTILQATEALKAKMAEHRALREEERRLEEERRRTPPRYV